jgi:hypothetical protein
MLETMGGKQMMRALSDAGDNVTEAAIMLGCAREISVLCRYLSHHVLAHPRLAPDVGEAEEGERGKAGKPMHLHNPRLRMKNTEVDPIEQLVDDSAGNLASLLEKTTKKRVQDPPGLVSRP